MLQTIACQQHHDIGKRLASHWDVHHHMMLEATQRKSFNLFITGKTSVGNYFGPLLLKRVVVHLWLVSNFYPKCNGHCMYEHLLSLSLRFLFFSFLGY